MFKYILKTFEAEILKFLEHSATAQKLDVLIKKSG